MQPASLATEPRPQSGRIVRVSGLVIAWLLLLGGAVSLFVPPTANGHTCHEMPVIGAFAGSSPCDKASQNVFVGGLSLVAVGLFALLFLRWRGRRQRATPQNRPGTLGGVAGFPALTADGSGLIISSEFLRKPLRIDAGAVELATFAPIDFGALQRIPIHWGIGPPARRPVTPLSFVFRSPTHVGPFARSTNGLRGITPNERRRGVDLDVFQVGVQDPAATRLLLSRVGIHPLEDPGPALRSRFGTADAFTLEGRAKLRQSLVKTRAVHALLVVGVAGLRLALVVNDDQGLKDRVIGWTAAALGVALIGLLGASRLRRAEQARSPEPRPDWTSPTTATRHDARDPRGEAQLRSLRRGAGVMAGLLVLLLLLSAVVAPTHRTAVAPRTISTAGSPVSAPSTSTFADIGHLVAAVDPAVRSTSVDISVHGGDATTSRVEPTEAYEWADPNGDFSVIVESFASRSDAASYHRIHTAGDMDDYSSVTLLDPPVSGATSFTCECGNVYVMFVRGVTRVVVQINPPVSNRQAAADRLARQIDLTLHTAAPHTTNGA